MQVQEYEKRLAAAIRMLGEEAGRRYMEQRLRDLRRDIERALSQEVLTRLADLTWHHPVMVAVSIGPQGVKVQLGRSQTGCRRPGQDRPEPGGGQVFQEAWGGTEEFA